MSLNHTDDSALALITARLLAASQHLSILSWLLCGLCLARILWQPAASHISTGMACLAVVLPTLYVAYLSLRLRLDSQLFADLAAQGLSPTQLDASLSQLGLRPNQPPRSIEARCQAALKLWRQWLLALVAQALWLLGWAVMWA